MPKMYDSYGEAHRGGKKASKMPKATDTMAKGYVPGGESWGGEGKANVKQSRLNAGGDKRWRGKRS